MQNMTFSTTFLCISEARFDLSSVCSGCWKSLITYYFNVYSEYFRNVFDSWDLEVHRKLQSPVGKGELLEFNRNWSDNTLHLKANFFARCLEVFNCATSNPQNISVEMASVSRVKCIGKNTDGNKEVLFWVKSLCLISERAHHTNILSIGGTVQSNILPVLQGSSLRPKEIWYTIFSNMHWEWGWELVMRSWLRNLIW
jgi:hypothetical protein